MDKLFSHPGFRLIFINDNGNMSLVNPSEDGFKENILEKGYRCVSHVWGTADRTKDYAWKDHGIANVNWKVEVREEKRERLLQIFNHHKGYFWMDVFCTNQNDDNKPLDVMGDIYRECVECVCMFDVICTVDGFTSEKDVLTNLAKDFKQHMEVAKDFYEKYEGYHEKFSGGNRESYLKNLAECGWFERVWTWQEAALPPRLLFCCGQAGEYRYDPFDQEFLNKLFPYRILEIGLTSMYEGSVEAISDYEQLAEYYGDFPDTLLYLDCIIETNRKNNIWQNIVTLAESTRKCAEKQDYIYGITGILNLDIPKGLTLDEAIVELEKNLQRRGIFLMGNSDSRGDISYLKELFYNLTPVDGILVLGKADVTKFPDIMQEYENHGKIISKEPYNNNEGYKYICWKYVTEISTIYLETDKYKVGDILETTKIGREGCTFQQADVSEYFKENEIFEIVDLRVRTIGHINDNMAEILQQLGFNSFNSDNDSGEREE